jgi:hypothetical protein
MMSETECSLHVELPTNTQCSCVHNDEKEDIADSNSSESIARAQKAKPKNTGKTRKANRKEKTEIKEN